MPLLTPDELQDFADLVTELAMDLPCKIKRKTYADDGYNSQSEDPIVVAESVCSVEVLPVPIMLEAQGGRIAALIKWNVHFPLGTGPLEGDIFEIEGQEMIAQRVSKPESFSVSDDVLASAGRTKVT